MNTSAGAARAGDGAGYRGHGPAVNPELSEIAALQEHLLPASLPELAGYEFAVFYRPCHAAGGDFYGFQQFADGRLGFVIADVAGHGARAAVMMAALRAGFAAFRVFGRPLESAPQDLNAILNEVAVPGVFVTAFLVSLDPASGRFYGGNCGHPPAMIRRANGSVEALAGSSDLPMGIAETIDPPVIPGQLEVGDTMVLYTDGLTECRDEMREFFGEQRLGEVIARADATSARTILTAVIEAVSEHQGPLLQADDQCMVVCRRVG